MYYEIFLRLSFIENCINTQILYDKEIIDQIIVL